MVHRDSFPVFRRTAALVVAVLAMGVLALPALGAVNAVTPSTNDINRTNGWAHVNQLSMDPGQTELQFVSTRAFFSCFEYRTDGDESQKTSDTNPNPAITDGLYPFVCVNNSTAMRTLQAAEYVEVRMVFGAEADERFDWTRFDVASKADCLDGGWEAFGFDNQGQCVRFANGAGDSR
jgi:hypothetical protein